MYAHVSKISWQFEAEDRVEGRVHNDGEADVRSISLKQGAMSEFELANHLWEELMV